MKIFIGEFKQESNSFNPILTDWDSFERLGILRGDELLTEADGLHMAVSGIVNGIRTHNTDAEIVPGIAMCSKSGGPVKQEVIDRFLQETETLIMGSVPFDGVFLSLHGATLSDTSNDVCGDILTAIRSWVGESTIISVSCDLHANITERMLKATDFIAGFLTYPHIDFYETGFRAAAMGMKRLSGRPLVTYAVHLPLLVSPGYYTTNAGEVHELIKYGHSMLDDKHICDYSLFLVQPWLDVPELASCVLIVSDDDEKVRSRLVDLARKMLDLKTITAEDFLPIEETIRIALENKTGKPVVLVDAADSPNAGATCDNATLLEKLLPYSKQLKVAFPINDYEAVRKAFSVGVGNDAVFSIGGKLAPRLSNPVAMECHIVSLHEGEFILEGPANRGSKCNIGRSAVLSVDSIKILVCEYATKIGDPQFYRGFGIEPTLCDLVIIKSCTSFREAYEQISAQICQTITSGAACQDLKLLPFENTPKPMSPFENVALNDISPIKCFRRC